MAQDKKAVAYLCGHLHQLGGAVPHMYTRQQNGILELELADWKHSRMYLNSFFFFFLHLLNYYYNQLEPSIFLSFEGSKKPTNFELVAQAKKSILAVELFCLRCDWRPMLSFEIYFPLINFQKYKIMKC